MREWLLTPMVNFGSFAALNDWLALLCRERSQRGHPTERSQSIAEHFVREQPLLRAFSATPVGYLEQMLRASSSSLVRVDLNRYSVPAEWAGKAVSVRRSATEIRVVAVVGRPRGRFRRTASGLRVSARIRRGQWLAGNE